MGTFLARYVMTRLVDDIDGSQAVTTLSFSLDGHGYEIDLSESHLSALQEALAPFISAARAVPNGRRPERPPAPKAQPPKAQPPAPKRASASNGHVIAADPATARPTAAVPTVDAPPFRQPEPAAEPATPKPRRAPLVADPFKPQA
jgi:Lsr2 protein